MNIPLLIVGFIIIAIAAVINFTSDFFTKKFINEDDIYVNPEFGFNEEETAKYKHDAAVIKVKKTAILILIVGVIIILIAAK